MTESDPDTAQSVLAQIEALQQAIETQDKLRPILGDAVVEAGLAPLREKLAALQAYSLGKHQLVTVLAAIISGLDSRRPNGGMSQETPTISKLWERLEPLVLSSGGRVDQQTEERLVAVWGSERHQEDDPERAVRAALEMRAEIARLNQEMQVPLSLGAGAHTGLVSIDGESHATGDTVDLALHIAKSALPDRLLLSQATYDQVRGLFSVEQHAALKVEGRAELLQTYLVKREKERTFYMPPRELAGVVTRTIGRENELSVMIEAYRRTISQSSIQWITITGEAGVGKTRLLSEFEFWVELRPEKIWYLKGRAWPHTQQTPYFLLRAVLCTRFQISDADPLEVARAKLSQGFGDGLSPELADEAAAFLGQLVGFDFHQSPWIANIVENTWQIRGRAEVLLRKFLESLCAQGPAILILEDLHWTDIESLVLLSDLLSQGQLWPLCVIGMARPEFWQRKVPWGEGIGGKPLPYHQRMELQPLSREQSEALVRELLQKVASPPNWLVGLLTERGGGNPYFIEELVHWLIEHEIILAGPDQWQVVETQPKGLIVPGTIQGVLQARLERLSPGLRATLQRAAVVGRVFWDEAVAYIGQEPISLESWKMLQQRDFVIQSEMRQPGGKEFQFRQMLLRDVVYEYTLVQQRRDYHRRAAEWLANVATERASEWAAVIADHYEEAGDVLVAAEWYGRAGMQSQATYAPDIAINYYQKALDLMPKSKENAPRRIEIYQGLGEALRWRARYEAAKQAHWAMLEAATIARDIPAQARAWLELSQTQDSYGEYTTALESAEQAEQLARAAGGAAQAELAQALFRKGWALYRLGSGEAALELGLQAYQLSSELSDRRQMANSLNLLGGVYNFLGRYTEALPCNQQSLTLYRELGDRERVASMQNNLGEHFRLSEDFRTAADYYQEALAMARETANRNNELVFANNLGGALVGLGDYPSAEEHLRTTIQIAELAGQIGWISETYRFLAEACLGQEKQVEARKTARLSLGLAQEAKAKDQIGGAWLVLGMIAAQALEPITIDGTSYDAVACFAKSLQVFQETGMIGEQARVLREWAKLERQHGDPKKGEAMWQEARNIFLKMGLDLAVEQMDLQRKIEA